MAEISLSRKLSREELDALQTEETKHRDAVVLESMAGLGEKLPKQLHRVYVKLEFTSNKSARLMRLMPAAVLEKSAIEAVGGPIEGMLLPKDRHCYVDLHGDADTCI
jgi:hypothetical protein